MKTRLFTLLSAFVLLFSLVSCDVSDQTTTDGTQQEIDTIPLIGQTTESETDAEAVPVTDGETRLSFICAGDNIIHEAVYNNAESGDDYKFDSIYEQIIPLIKDADISYINQESPICGDELGISGYPTFNSPESLGDFLIESGFDIVNLANNHIFDNLQKGLEGTLSYWKTKNIFTVGAYEDEADYEDIRVFEKDGVKIAMLSYTDFINSSKMKVYTQLKSDGDMDAVIPFTDSDVIVQQIEYAKTVSDLVFVSMHWGEEDEHVPDSEQKKTAQLIADAGADVIIGSHPHVVQEIEWLEGEDGNKTLCIYSLGNILSTMEYARNLVGMMVRFDIVKTDDAAYIENIEAIPTVTYYEYHPDYPGDNTKRTDVKLYLMDNFTEQMADSHGCNDNESKHKSLDDFRSYITDYVDKKYLK